MSNPAPKFKRQVLVSFFLSLFILLIGVSLFKVLVAFKKKIKRVAKESPKVAVQVMAVHRQNFREFIYGYGKVQALQKSSIATEVSGIIDWISPKLEGGSFVQKKEILLKIRSKDYILVLKKAKVNHKIALLKQKNLQKELVFLERQLSLIHQEVKLTKEEVDRILKLKKAKEASIRDVEQQKIILLGRQRNKSDLTRKISNLKNSLQQSQLEVKLRALQVEESLNNVKKCKIFSPYSGKIISRNTFLGNRVNPGNILFEMMNIEKIEIPIAVGASHFGKISLTSKVAIRLSENQNFSWIGEVSRIAPNIDSASQSFKVYIQILKKTEKLFVPGTFLEAKMKGQMYKKVFVIPRGAFTGKNIFVVDSKYRNAKEGIVRVRKIKKLIFLVDRVVVQEGIKEGEEIILTNVEQIASGSRVILVRPTSSKNIPHIPNKK